MNNLAISTKSITFAAANTTNTTKKAPVAELVDALDLGSSVSRRAGSSPVRRTEQKEKGMSPVTFLFSY